MASNWRARIREIFRPTVVVNPEPEDLLEAALELAQTQRLAQIADETSLDGRTIGVLAFAGALLAADVAAQADLGKWWWTALLLGIGLAMVPCVISILQADTDLGPRSFEFYADYGGHPSAVARKQLLTDLDTALVANTERVNTKRLCLRWAIGVLVVGLIGATLMITLDTPTTIATHGKACRHGKAGSTAAAATTAARCDARTLTGPAPNS